MNNHHILKNSVRATFKVGKWTVKVIPAIEGYRQTGHADLDADSIVQFYDNSQSVEKFGSDGQFVSSYYLRCTLFDKRYGGGNKGAFSLQGDVPAWTVSAEDYATIRKFLKALL